MTGRVVFFDGYPHTAGGVARMCLQVSAAVAEQGRRLEVVVPADGAAADLYRRAGIPVRVVPAPHALQRYGGAGLRGRAAIEAVLALPGYWRHLADAFRGSELVHVNDFRGLIVAAPAARLARCALVWQVHSQIASRLAGWLARLLRATVAVVSRAVTPRGLSRRTRVHLLPNAVDVDAPIETGAEAVPVVLCVGRMHPEKGIDTLVTASARLTAAGVMHRLVVVGGSQTGYESYRAQLQRLVADLNVTDVVDLVGEVDDVTTWLRRASVYVQPSRREAFGLAVLEAMHAGLPVVASDVGGLPELVVDGVTGRLVPPGDPEALAAAIRSLLVDATLRRSWGEAARERAQQHFGIPRFRAALRDVYAAASAATVRV